VIKALTIKLVAVAGIALCVLLLPQPANWLAAAGVLMAALALIAWAVFDVNSSFWSPTLWRSPTPVNAVALTFDDGPDPQFTPAVLDLLKQRGVKAAFFCVGARVREHPELVRRIAQEGHILGNHSDSHAMWINFSMRKRLRREVTACNESIEQAAGVKPRLYRAPHGFKNPALGDVLKEQQMQAVGWQVRGFDAVVNDAAHIAKRIVDQANPGGVILLHDGAGLQGTQDRAATLQALPVVIDGLRARGQEVVPLDELLATPAYTKQVP
jgi:peptidoglycan/xylan/chitin deacetylase (PgdA/CDA1 family)